MFDNPYTIAAAIIAVILVGFAKGGFAGLGALATPGDGARHAACRCCCRAAADIDCARWR